MHIPGVKKTFDYMGSKYSVIPWLLPLLGECEHYVTVFGGGGVDLINRAPSKIETYNDINGKVVNFFKVLREKPEELISLLELTPHSRAEYEACWFREGDTDIEKARKFFVRLQQSIFSAGAQNQNKGWALSLDQARGSISEKTRKWINGVANLREVVERFRRVQIENRDFRYVITKYDRPGVLFYCDPPYDKEKRSSTKYEFDFERQDFYDLKHLAENVKCRIAISGYDSSFMIDLFKNFNFHKGPHRKNGRSQTVAHECLWTNF